MDPKPSASQIDPRSLEEAHQGVRAVLKALGEDPDRPGLSGTPQRVVRALLEMTAGHDQDPGAILSQVFEVEEGRADELIVLRGVEFSSLCEHHILPFSGVATVGYLPGRSNQVVGISKLARLVEAYGSRLQIQERMGHQIVTALDRHLGARGSGVVLIARHQCMGCRGVVQPRAEMVTTNLTGQLRLRRAEFLQLAGLSMLA